MNVHFPPNGLTLRRMLSRALRNERMRIKPCRFGLVCPKMQALEIQEFGHRFRQARWPTDLRPTSDSLRQRKHSQRV